MQLQGMMATCWKVNLLWLFSHDGLFIGICVGLEGFAGSGSCRRSKPSGSSAASTVSSPLPRPSSLSLSPPSSTQMRRYRGRICRRTQVMPKGMVTSQQLSCAAEGSSRKDGEAAHKQV